MVAWSPFCICFGVGLGAKLEQATADHEAVLTSNAALHAHSQFPGRTLINLMNEAIKVSLIGSGRLSCVPLVIRVAALISERVVSPRHCTGTAVQLHSQLHSQVHCMAGLHAKTLVRV